jgi:hypothetical protein
MILVAHPVGGWPAEALLGNRHCLAPQRLDDKWSRIEEADRQS